MQNMRKDRDKILARGEESPELRNSYRHLPPPLRERFLDFLRGARTLPLTYDPFFKAIFDPRLHPERLSGLISSLLGIPVKVKEILPTEDRMMDGESLLIMDVMVELEEKQRQIDEQKEQLNEKLEMLCEKQRQINDQKKQLLEKDQEIRMLKEALARMQPGV